jgi:putative nucleotidyltransferase with HDIG domain
VPATRRIPLISVIAGLSHALDLTEGHPPGHANRACIIGMRIAGALGLPERDLAPLHHALLLKDAGCSSNAQRVHELFGGDDHEVKRAVWLRDWRRFFEQAAYAIQYTERGGSLTARLRKLMVLAAKGPRGGGELFRIRCDRGAQIALGMGFPRETADAIRAMDEHWDGGGYPDGLAGDDIPLAARIINVAQVAEIFFGLGGPELAIRTIRRRAGRWFDPQVAAAFDAVARDAGFWQDLRRADLIGAVTALEPVPMAVEANPDTLRRIALAFAWVVDAKSPYTFEHSEGVARVAVAVAGRLGFDDRATERLRLAALLHDIGKLAVPNRILDKPGTLTPDERRIINEHPRHTVEILKRVPALDELADDAGAHHERLDGRGYHRGLDGTQLSPAARVLAVSDLVDALRSDRPYRAGLPPDAVQQLLEKERGSGCCPDAVDAAIAVLQEDRPAFAGSSPA